MNSEKFINFLDSLNIEENLLESILDGYSTVFCESILTPMPFASINMPMGSYQNIYKMEPSGSDENYSTDNYVSGESTRDLNEETRKEWQNATTFPRYHKHSSKSMKKVIQKAQEHIPQWGENDATPVNYFTNVMSGGISTFNSFPAS